MIDPPASLRGSIVPLVTPFSGGGVDYAAYEESGGFQLAAGSHGVVVSGTTGEPTSLTLVERAELYRRAVAAADGRGIVVAATGSANHADTLELTTKAEAAGVDAVLVVCPPFVKPSREGLVAHFVAVGRATNLPMMIYNIPGRSAVGVDSETVKRIADQLPNLVGLKHSSPDLDLVTDLILSLGEEFRLFCGLESYSYPFLAVGGAGLMSAVGNLAPTQVVELCQFVADDDHRSALMRHRALFRINQAIFFETNPVPLKTMISMLGRGSGEVRLPLVAASPDLQLRLEPIVAELRELTQKARV